MTSLHFGVLRSACSTCSPWTQLLARPWRCGVKVDPGLRKSEFSPLALPIWGQYWLHISSSVVSLGSKLCHHIVLATTFRLHKRRTNYDCLFKMIVSAYIYHCFKLIRWHISVIFLPPSTNRVSWQLPERPPGVQRGRDGRVLRER